MVERFQGSNHVNLDAKGRLAVPTCYREPLARTCANTLVLTVGPLDTCLWLYPSNVWEVIVPKLEGLSDFDLESRRTKQMMLGSATAPQVLDVQGRIRVPEPLRRHAGLEKSITVLGQGHRFEIWDSDTWAEQSEQWLQRVRSGVGAASETLKGLAL